MPSRSFARPVAGTLVAGLLAVSCGGGSGDTTTSPDTNSGATTAAPATPQVADAPEILQFTSALVGGGQLDASTLAGKPTAFWFWAPT